MVSVEGFRNQYGSRPSREAVAETSQEEAGPATSALWRRWRRTRTVTMKALMTSPMIKIDVFWRAMTRRHPTEPVRRGCNGECEHQGRNEVPKAN